MVTLDNILTIHPYNVKVDIPDVEAFVIYTGKRKIDKEELSLNLEYLQAHRAEVEKIMIIPEAG